jgi:hypothetical protein
MAARIVPRRVAVAAPAVVVAAPTATVVAVVPVAVGTAVTPAALAVVVALAAAVLATIFATFATAILATPVARVRPATAARPTLAHVRARRRITRRILVGHGLPLDPPARRDIGAREGGRARQRQPEGREGRRRALHLEPPGCRHP